MTAAPGTMEPDLSVTLPAKLPVAWACMAGEFASERTQTTRRNNILQDFVVRFIVRPLFFDKTAKVVLHRLGFPGIV